jgi:hypothetical protein
MSSGYSGTVAQDSAYQDVVTMREAARPAVVDILKLINTHFSAPGMIDKPTRVESVIGVVTRIVSLGIHDSDRPARDFANMLKEALTMMVEDGMCSLRRAKKVAKNAKRALNGLDDGGALDRVIKHYPRLYPSSGYHTTTRFMDRPNDSASPLSIAILSSIDADHWGMHGSWRELEIVLHTVGIFDQAWSQWQSPVFARHQEINNMVCSAQRRLASLVAGYPHLLVDVLTVADWSFDHVDEGLEDQELFPLHHYSNLSEPYLVLAISFLGEAMRQGRVGVVHVEDMLSMMGSGTPVGLIATAVLDAISPEHPSSKSGYRNMHLAVDFPAKGFKDLQSAPWLGRGSTNTGGQ